MPSRSYLCWADQRATALDQLEQAHQAVGGGGVGRRVATLQINHAYAVLLSSQFQGYCRDLHSEAVDHLVSVVQPQALQAILRAEFTRHRHLDRGNPTPGNLGVDFNRLLGAGFWPQVLAHDPRNAHRQQRLQDLSDWRNAIAHQDFARVGGEPNLQLRTVRGWRGACNGLARAFEEVLRVHILAVAGISPW